MSEENQPIEQNENHVILERREKLKKIREAGVAFPNDFKPQHFAKTIHEEFGLLENDALEPKAVEYFSSSYKVSPTKPLHEKLH